MDDENDNNDGDNDKNNNSSSVEKHRRERSNNNTNSDNTGVRFALTAAQQQGHRGTLYDRDQVIGGQFHMAKRISGKEEFYETLRYFHTMLRKLNVNVQLGTELSIDDMQLDTWVVATGVTPRMPGIPGQDHPNVVSYIDILKTQSPRRKMLVLEDDLEHCATALRRVDDGDEVLDREEFV